MLAQPDGPAPRLDPKVYANLKEFIEHYVGTPLFPETEMGIRTFEKLCGDVVVKKQGRWRRWSTILSVAQEREKEELRDRARKPRNEIGALSVALYHQKFWLDDEEVRGSFSEVER